MHQTVQTHIYDMRMDLVEYECLWWRGGGGGGRGGGAARARGAP